MSARFARSAAPRRSASERRTRCVPCAVAELAPRGVIAAAERVLGAVSGPWLYARVDGVETRDGFLLMELEMLEPLLFLELDPGAPGRFADAIVAVVERDAR